jgi:hypothetical protein
MGNYYRPNFKINKGISIKDFKLFGANLNLLSRFGKFGALPAFLSVVSCHAAVSSQ